MRSRDDLEASMKAAASHFGGIDLLFNNAGTHDTDLTPHTAVHELPDEVWDMVCEVNLRSIWYGVRAALPYLRHSKGASIINPASIASYLAMPVSPAYNAPTRQSVG